MQSKKRRQEKKPTSYYNSVHVFQHLLSMLVVMSFGKVRFYILYVRLLKNKYQCEHRYLFLVCSQCWMATVKVCSFTEFRKCGKITLWIMWKDGMTTTTTTKKNRGMHLKNVTKKPTNGILFRVNILFCQ